MTQGTIVELRSEAELRRAFPVMSQLRIHLTEDAFIQTVTTMRAEGYRLFATLVENEVVAGVTIATNLYHDRHCFVYDLVTDETHRSQGFGERLRSHVETWAREQGCEQLVLSSGLQRTNAHRFYEERIGMDRASYQFVKSL